LIIKSIICLDDREKKEYVNCFQYHEDQ